MEAKKTKHKAVQGSCTQYKLHRIYQVVTPVYIKDPVVDYKSSQGTLTSMADSPRQRTPLTKIFISDQ